MGGPGERGDGGDGGTGRAAVAPDGAQGLPALEYPQAYVFKAIGLAGDDFAEHVRAIVARVVPDAGGGQVAVRSSSGGKYHAVSVTIRLESESQRRAVYQALHADVRVVYCL